MPTVYSYTYSSEGQGPWWGIRCPSEMYRSIVEKVTEMERYFVYLTSVRGDTLAVAIEGPHSDDHDTIFVPEWILSRLGIEDGDVITIDPILEVLASAELVRIQPITVASVENPIFVEGLTQALNQLGIVQEGLLSAIVDPSMPELHEFLVENLSPAKVCLANGDLNVDLVSAVDYVEEFSSHEYSTSPMESTNERPDTPMPPDQATVPLVPVSNVLSNAFVPFSGKGYCMSDYKKKA